MCTFTKGFSAVKERIIIYIQAPPNRILPDQSYDSRSIRQVGAIDCVGELKIHICVLHSPQESKGSRFDPRKLMATKMTSSLLRSQAAAAAAAATVATVATEAVRRINSVTPRRYLFHWLTAIFNRVDDDRMKKFGPDRVCAEWLLRNGASVRWKGAEDYLKDYNLLPREEQEEQYYIEAVDATDSAINHIGFPHFKGCKYIVEMKLVRCNYIENEALHLLDAIKESLNQLEVLDCNNITEEGLYGLQKLRNLKKLRIGGTPYVKNRSQVLNKLQESLPNCNIQYDKD